MKILPAIVLAFVALAATAAAASRLEKSALLLLPDVISIHGGLSASVEFKWDEEKPVTLDTWSFDGRLSTYGEIAVFEDGGKEVPTIYPLSMPLLPSGKKEVKKGEVLKIVLYKMGWIQFPRPGRYYAIATFDSAFSGETNVRFTTEKRWFEVTEAEPKDANQSSLPIRPSVTPRAEARGAPAALMAGL